VDMNCQQICKISRKKTLTKVKIFQKVLEGATFLKHPVDDRGVRPASVRPSVRHTVVMHKN